jgi:hypothetical protein
MFNRRSIRVLCAAGVLSVAFAGPLTAQQKSAPAPAPSPAAMLMAKEIIDLKGAGTAFDPLIRGVIEYHKNFLINTNPNLARDIDLVANNLLKELEPRKVELQQQLARTYAQHFTEQELKDAIAFYRTPLGKKLVTEEPKAMEETMKAADTWSRKFAEEVVAKLRAELKKKGLNVI